MVGSSNEWPLPSRCGAETTTFKFLQSDNSNRVVEDACLRKVLAQVTVDEQVNAIIDVVTEEFCARADEEPAFIEEVQKNLYGKILKILTPPSLADYGLVVGQEVKFVPPNSSNKRTGRVRSMNSDGSIYVQDNKKGFGRSIPVDDLYVEVTGPRGGTVLKKVTDT